MKGTTQLPEAIYGTENGHLYEQYAMTNAAKCSRAGPGSGKVGHVLYKNCSQFVVPELACLDPDMIVTQGNEACGRFVPRIVSRARRKPTSKTGLSIKRSGRLFANGLGRWRASI